MPGHFDKHVATSIHDRPDLASSIETDMVRFLCSWCRRKRRSATMKRLHWTLPLGIIPRPLKSIWKLLRCVFSEPGCLPSNWCPAVLMFLTVITCCNAGLVVVT